MTMETMEMTHEPEAQMTLAELCAAIADGRLRASLREDAYEVSGAELRKLRRLDIARRLSPLSPSLPGDAPSMRAQRDFHA